jgi:hypothetical protein
MTVHSDVHTGDYGAATATAGAATCNHNQFVVTSEALTTAAGSQYTLTLTNSAINAESLVLVSVRQGTNTKSGLVVNEVTPAAGSVVIIVKNGNAAALDGTIKISGVVL